MQIQNYAVAMTSQYFNLEIESTEANISETSESFIDESSQLNTIEVDKSKTQESNNELSKALSQAILKNLHNETEKFLGDRVEFSSTYTEAQSLSYQVQAIIQADGKEKEISIDVALSRSFVQTTSIELTLAELRDPLVISLNGEMPSLGTNSFAFDIDSDGKKEQISQLRAGSGFLAFDKDENGKIDNGSELFGTKSGDGFADLKMYDDDGNGWIDENDKIFDKLRIWQKSEDQDKLVALGEVGIGAIFLESTQTPFSIKSETNQLLGEIRKSSFAVFENGRAGVVSQIDFAIVKETKNSLNAFYELKNDFTIKSRNNLYQQNEKSTKGRTTEDTNDKISQIQAKITELENKLSRASEFEKSSIQVQIGILYSKIMALLSV